MQGICYIVGAGACEGISINKNENDYIISADGGYAHLLKIGIEPNLAVGDFDSLGYIPNSTKTLVHKPEKDDTDMFLAICEGIELGYKKFLIYGGLGGRFDHSLANIQCLNYLAEKNLTAWLWGENTALTVIKNRKINLPKRENGYISVFANSEKAENVDISGLKYELKNGNLTATHPLGVSNEFIGKKSEISVKNGRLSITFNCRAEEIEILLKNY